MHSSHTQPSSPSPTRPSRRQTQVCAVHGAPRPHRSTARKKKRKKAKASVSAAARPSPHACRKSKAPEDDE